MKFRNSHEHFGLVSRVNHWITAVLFFILIPMGEIMEEWGEDDIFSVNPLFDLHVALGVLLMILVVIRILWLPIAGKVQQSPSSEMQKLLVKGVRLALWVGLVAIPLSGWIMMNAAGTPLTFFEWFDLPMIVPESHWLAEFSGEIHESLPGLMVVAILLHVLGALKHHYIDGDNTLKRMMSRF